MTNSPQRAQNKWYLNSTNSTQRTRIFPEFSRNIFQDKFHNYFYFIYSKNSSKVINISQDKFHIYFNFIYSKNSSKFSNIFTSKNSSKVINIFTRQDLYITLFLYIAKTVQQTNFILSF